MKNVVLIVIAVLVALFLWFSLYTIDETEQAIILEFGRPIGETFSSPGLHFKLPWRTVIKFENRILEYDVEPQAVITSDKKKLEVDNYARWRIADPLLFYRSVRTLNGALSRIDPIVYSELRVELGKHELSEIVDKRRVKIMEMVSVETQGKLAEYGIEIIDVRIKRADLSKENERAVFDRMRLNASVRQNSIVLKVRRRRLRFGLKQTSRKPSSWLMHTRNPRYFAVRAMPRQ